MIRNKYPARRILKAAMIAVVFSLLAGTAWGQLTSGVKPQWMNNQLIVRFASGTTDAQAGAKAQELGMKVVRKMELPDTFLLERLPTRADVSIESIKTRATTDASVVSAQFNNFLYPHAVPNDPRWLDLWGMPSIRAPQAWDLQKGSASVIVAVVDTGVFLNHEDLQGRVIAGKDTGGAKVDDPADHDDDPNPSTDPAVDPGAATHGTHVSGTIAAQGNNQKGVIGVCWDGVKILAVKVCADDIPTGGMTTADIVAGLDFVLNYRDTFGKGVSVVNMSLGGDSPDEAIHQKIVQLYNAGIVVCVSAGNDGRLGVSYPAAYDEAIAVSAIQRNDDLTSYSNWGPEIDIAAPGGDGNTADMILSTTWSLANGQGYGYLMGTSMACPHVAGAAALLISHNITNSPGGEEVKKRLQSSARTPQIGGYVDPRKFGAGIVDLSNALKPPAGTIEILEPKNAAALESHNVRFVIRLSRVKRDTIKIWIDYQDKQPADGKPDDINGVMPVETLTGMDSRVTYDSVTNTLTFDYQVNPDSGGAENPTPTYNIYVQGIQDSGPTASASAIFFVNPRTEAQGVHLFSIPYALAPDTLPENIIQAENFTLRRWAPEAGDGGAYVTYTAGSGSDAWTNFLANTGARPHGSTINTPPTGLGMWLDLQTSAPLSPQGSNSITDKAYDIDLFRPTGSAGWNMIGNPFPFSVNWGTVSFTYRGATKTLDDAVSAGWIRPLIYRYQNGDYVFDQAPYGVLEPWQGYWVRALVGEIDLSTGVRNPLVISIPPLRAASRVAESGTTRAAGLPDGWTIRLRASAGGVTDAYNFAGTSTRAADGYDRYDAEKAPQDRRELSLAFIHRDWGENSGKFAQDIKTGIGTGKTWEFEVTSTLANKDVQISWPSLDALPKQYKAVLEDVDSGSRVYMATRSSYTYNSGPSGGARHFKLNVAPDNKGRLLVTGVNVTRNRGAGVTIAYSVSRDAKVEVRLRNAGNRTIKTLGSNTTRAAGLSSVVWDGLLNSGEFAPSGLYLAEIVATDADGEIAKAIRPILLK